VGGEEYWDTNSNLKTTLGGIGKYCPCLLEGKSPKTHITRTGRSTVRKTVRSRKEKEGESSRARRSNEGGSVSLRWNGGGKGYEWGKKKGILGREEQKANTPKSHAAFRILKDWKTGSRFERTNWGKKSIEALIETFLWVGG